MLKEGGIHIPVLFFFSYSCFKYEEYKRDYSCGCGIKLFLSFKVGI